MRGRRKTPDQFWAQVDKSGSCWNWTGPLSIRGTPFTHYEGVREHAHRIAYRLANGDVPDLQQVRRSCRNQTCVNPEHLYIRRPLTELAFLAEEWLSGDETQAEVGKRHGVARETVARAVKAHYESQRGRAS